MTYIWDEKEEAPSGRLSCQNVLSRVPGVTAACRRQVNSDEVSSAFFLLFDDFIVRRIVACTEKENLRKNGANGWQFSREDLLSFIGLLFIRGATSASKFHYESMWSEKWGLPICKETMSRNAFRNIMQNLRFDEKSSRSARVIVDKFCMISEIWNRFLTNGQIYFNPKENLTVDEQLLPSKTRCPYTQYMPQKPDKFGIKFWVLCDTETKFVLNSIPYLGRDEFRPSNTQLGEHVVMELTKPYYKGGYNVTCDNFFTSAKVAEALRKQRCSLVGTVRKNRMELPKSLQEMQESLATFDTKFLRCRQRDLSLTVYKCKPNKSVCILSTLHRRCSYGPSPKKLPETVAFYNNTKYGVDIFDSMARKYTTKAGSRRWPMHCFYNLLDICVINSWILFKLATGSQISRRAFLLRLGEVLCRFGQTAHSISHIANSHETSSTLKRKDCQISSHHNKTSYKCNSCSKWCCGTCTGTKVIVITCKKCL
jgi:hypothetical protein